MIPVEPVYLVADDLSGSLTSVARDKMLSNRCRAVTLVVLDPISGRYVTIQTPKPLPRLKER